MLWAAGLRLPFRLLPPWGASFTSSKLSWCNSDDAVLLPAIATVTVRPLDGDKKERAEEEEASEEDYAEEEKKKMEKGEVRRLLRGKGKRRHCKTQEVHAKKIQRVDLGSRV